MRRLLVLAALTVLVVLGRADPGGALTPLEPTVPTTTTRPVVITEPEGIYDDPTTTAPTTGPPIGGPDGDVVDEGLVDEVMPQAAIVGGVLVLVAAAVTVALTARRRSS